MNIESIKNLKMMIKLANDLDKKGLHKEADILDGILQDIVKKQPIRGLLLAPRDL